MNALDYFLKANLYAGLFAGCYWLWLRRHTFFGVNRAYLLASVVLSLSLPLVSLPTQAVETLPASWAAPVGVIALPTVVVSSGANAVLPIHAAGAEPDQPINGELVGMWLYGVVASVLLVRLGRGVWKLLRRISRIRAGRARRVRAGTTRRGRYAHVFLLPLPGAQPRRCRQ